MKEPTGKASPHNRRVQLVDTVSSGKQTRKHHSHVRSVPSIVQANIVTIIEYRILPESQWEEAFVHKKITGSLGACEHGSPLPGSVLDGGRLIAAPL